MNNLSFLKNVALEQLEQFKKKDTGIERNIDFKKYLRTKQIVVISGIRRSGKSTFLAQISKRISNFYYLSFDDERLIDFSVKDFDLLMLIFKKLYRSKNILLDEIQNVENWERFVRRIYEEGYKIFLTGSNAKDRKSVV